MDRAKTLALDLIQEDTLLKRSTYEVRSLSITSHVHVLMYSPSFLRMEGKQ